METNKTLKTERTLPFKKKEKTIEFFNTVDSYVSRDDKVLSELAKGHICLHRELIESLDFHLNGYRWGTGEREEQLGLRIKEGLTGSREDKPLKSSK